MTSEEIAQCFRARGAYFCEIDKAAQAALGIGRVCDRAELTSEAIDPPAVLIRGQQPPAVRDSDAQRHFAAGLSRYKEVVETIAGQTAMLR